MSNPDNLKLSGCDELWGWFELSYASWLTLPRVLMHEMPDDWQRRMAQLLKEWDETWDTECMPGTRVQAVSRSGGLTKFDPWLLNYRRPDKGAINAARAIVQPTPPKREKLGFIVGMMSMLAAIALSPF